MPETKQTVICVAGMHRSGTSMITRLLNLCGMDLGEGKDLMPASPANPEGYWEHIWFNFYNNELLSFFGGGWDLVPVYPEDWTATAGIEWIRREIRTLIARYNSPVWGWKDPRNSITLPFWKEMIPGLRTVVCLRNPLDVARSLNKRGSSSVLMGLQLWWQYNSLILLRTTAEERVVTDFDVYFREGKAELHRMLSALEMEATEEAIAQACGASKEALRHSLTGIGDLEKVCPWPGLTHTYAKLLSECGEAGKGVLGLDGRVAEMAARWTPESCCLPTPFIGSEQYRAAARRAAETQTQAVITQQALAAAVEREGELQRQLTTVTGKEHSLQEQLTAATGREHDLQDRLSAAAERESETQRQFAAATAREHDLREQFAAATARERDLQGQLAALTGRERDLREQLTAAAERERELQGQFTAATARERELQGQLTALTAKERDLQEQFTAAMGREHTLQVQLASLTEKERDLRGQFTAAMGRERDLQGQHAALTAKERDLREQFTAATGREHDLQAQLAEVRATERDLQQRLGQTEEAVVQASAQRDRAMEQLSAVAAENHAIKQSRSFQLLVRASGLGLKLANPFRK